MKSNALHDESCGASKLPYKNTDFCRHCNFYSCDCVCSNIEYPYSIRSLFTFNLAYLLKMLLLALD